MANPFNQNDPSEENAYKKMIASCVAAASLVVLLFLVVLYLNNDKKNPSATISKKQPEEVEEEFEYGKSNLKSSDLDFWDMYDEEEAKVSEEGEEGDKIPYKKGSNENDADENDKESLNKKPEKDPGSNDEADNDENHLAVVNAEGKTTYYEILDNIKKNDFDLKTPLDADDKGHLIYKSENRSAFTGIDLSKADGNIDFAQVKSDGIDFAMLRIGIRGYSSGTITLDDKFVEYATNARANNIYVGAYFVSSAITEQEAIEEASFAVGAVGNHGIKYPIAIDLDSSADEAKRTDSLTMKDRTRLVKSFCDTVKQYGYNPIIRASRDTLISKLNLEDIQEYDIWLCDSNNPTDYPYQFAMWQYAKDGKVNGIEGEVRIDMSFVRFEEK